jgi:hypothetical protein
MKRNAIIFASALAAALMVCGVPGCASKDAAGSALEAYRAFQAQPRTYNAVRAEFADAGGRVTLESVRTLEMQAPLNPLSAMQGSDNIARLVDAVKNALLGAFGIYTLGQVASMEPTVVKQPEPMIVRPEIITVPAGGAP